MIHGKCSLPPYFSIVRAVCNSDVEEVMYYFNQSSELSFLVAGRIAIPLALEFLKRWPTPQEACQAKLYDILDVIEPLGFGRTRAAIIIRFSRKCPSSVNHFSLAVTLLNVSLNKINCFLFR